MLTKEVKPILWVTTIYLILFTIFFLVQGNIEFLFYVGVIVFFLLVILFTYQRVNYPVPVLWGLSLWGLLHLAGGGIIINGKILYTQMLFTVVGEPYLIFKYDQLVHIIGFAVATLVMFYLLKPYLNLKNKKKVALSIVIVMAGLGVGALNEIIEFIITVVVPETNVGGYENTALDLIADLIGGLLALGYIAIKEFKKK